jgi:hypothetical protein
LKFDEIEPGKARAEQLRGVTVFSMKRLVVIASNFASKRQGQPQYEAANMYVAEKSFVVPKSARFIGEIENVFYWDH